MSIDSERPIIITGGSIDVDLPDNFEPEPGPKGERIFKPKKRDMKITKITLTIGGDDEPMQEFYISDGICKIRVDYE